LVSTDTDTELFGVVFVSLTVIEFLVLFWEVRRNRDRKHEKHG